MSHARIEEVSDSDESGAASDPSEGDIEDFAETDILRVVDPKRSAPAQSNVASASSAGGTRDGAAASAATPASRQEDFHTTTDAKQYADYHCLYPVYFDATRTRAEGRRVAAGLAVRNPLAREIVNACAALRVPTLFEPGKSHPKDWGNPGRVKVRLPGDGGGNGAKAGGGGANVKNKHHLFLLVAEHLRANPTGEDSLMLRARVQGVPPAVPQGKPWPRPAVPRGWKIGELVPYISPAMTGGGVSENLFKDMMKEMQGSPGGAGGLPQGMPGMPGMPPGMMGEGDNPMAALMGGEGGGGGGGNGGAGGGGKKGKKGKGKGKA